MGARRSHRRQVVRAPAYLLFARGLTRVPAATAGTLSLAEPLTAAALGIVVLAERPSTSALGGALLLVIGLALTAVVPGSQASRARTPVTYSA